LSGGCARRLKQRRMATKTGLYRSRIEPLEDIADGRVRGRSTSGVRGPVLAPPYILHRPDAIAGLLQGLAALVLAPHRGEA
jgi:hypothetical protein